VGVAGDADHQLDGAAERLSPTTNECA
jgi:hypothetical protein